jgi:glycosyltransferase involved in cell wall biosynthesis
VPEPSTILVVPCFNEAARLRGDAFLAGLEADPDLRLLFVDDGSSDGTAARLTALAQQAPARIELVVLAANAGKAEAVRRGMLEALREEPRYVGFWDADLATPLDALPALRRVLDERPEVHCVLGSRIQRLGSTIARSALRHYAGRVIATFASRTLRLPVYDTQCGAKLFRVSPLVFELFTPPFLSRWLFDVEILARLSAMAARGELAPPTVSAHEVPLVRWTDEPGSKVKPWDFFRALRDLRRIRRAYPPPRLPGPPGA